MHLNPQKQTKILEKFIIPMVAQTCQNPDLAPRIAKILIDQRVMTVEGFLSNAEEPHKLKWWVLKTEKLIEAGGIKNGEQAQAQNK